MRKTPGGHIPPSPLLRVRHTFAAKRRPQAGRPPLLTPRFSATRTFIYIHIYTSRYTVFVLRYIFCQLVAGPLHPQRKAVQIYPVPFQNTPRRGAGHARTRAESLDLGSLCGAVAQDLRMGNEVSGLDCCGQGAERGREGGRQTEDARHAAPDWLARVLSSVRTVRGLDRSGAPGTGPGRTRGLGILRQRAGEIKGVGIHLAPKSAR